MNNKYLLYQVTDTLFPIGAYAHSYGLETYISRNIITSSQHAEQYIKSYIHNNMCYSDLLSIRFAYEYAVAKRISDIINLEQIATVSKVSEEIRQANIKLGSRFIKIIRSLDLQLDSLFMEYADNKEVIHTYSVAYGVFCACSGISLQDALQRFAFMQASSFVTNCVKIIPLSQTSGQQILYRLIEEIDIAIETAMTLTENDLFISCHGSDIRSMQHEVLYSRIFMS